MSNYTETVDNWLKDRGIIYDFHRVGNVEKWGSLKPMYAISFYRDDGENGLGFVTEFYSHTDPTAYDVLSCLQKSEVAADKWEFFEEMGLAPSKELEKTYQAVRLEWEKVSEFFTESELVELQEIAQ